MFITHNSDYTPRMRFYFSWKVTLTCSVLILGALRLSLWQWNRHLEKQTYIQIIESRIAADPVSLSSILNQGNVTWNDLPYRKVTISGRYDFEHEMILRNRRYEEEAGAYVLTPLHIDGRGESILVSRGFIPLEKISRYARVEFRQSEQTTFVGLLKEPSAKRLFAPADPNSGGAFPWVDAWLRVDLEKIQKQIPYPLIPLWVEIMSTEDSAAAQKKILTSPSKREEMLFLASEAMARQSHSEKNESPMTYPIPVFDTVVPPGRHLGYVYEWAFMALMTFCIGLVLQLRPSKHQNLPQGKTA
jgi:surfeit locus 1 family protein